MNEGDVTAGGPDARCGRRGRLRVDVGVDVADAIARRTADAPVFRSGGGGDFGGGGASGSFDPPSGLADAASSIADGAGSLLDGADEGVVVAVPIAVVLGILALLTGLLGAGLFLLFGVDVLLAVTVEVSLASLAGSLAFKGVSEGWLSTALAHTWKGALVALLLAVALGAVVDRWLPQARSLPHALRMLQHR